MRTPANLTGAIYGTVLATSLVAAFSENDEYSSGEIALYVFTTGLVFWLAHVHASLFGKRYAAGRALSRREILGEFRSEWPLEQAVFPPVVVMLLGAIGVFSKGTAITVAIVVGVAALVAWGIEIGRRERLGPLRIVAVTLANALFGVAIVGLKLAIH
jgi:hypothetical protein